MAMGKLEANEKSQGRSKRKEKDVLPTKLVVRRLPASLTEEDLREVFVGIPEYDYFRFVAPDYSLQPNAFGRAYINFKKFEDLTQFRNKYDGYIFNAGKGDESSAVVEVAPYQGIPRENRKRKDLKSGTITKDPDYETFLENLNKKVEPLPSAEVYVEQMESNKAGGSAEKLLTPLVEFLNKKKASKNLSRQNAAALENERKLKRDKDLGRDASKSKNDEKYSGKESGSKKDKIESSGGSKGSQEKRGAENKRKEDRRERRGTSGRKDRNDQREIKDSKDQKRESKRENDDERPMSGRSDTSRRNEGRINKREDRRMNDRRNQDDRRSRDEKREDRNQKRVDDQKKAARAELMKKEEKRPRRKSIEYEDPSIVAFGKSVDTNKDSGRYGNKTPGNDGAKRKEDEAVGKSKEQEKGKKDYGRNENQMDDMDRKIRNKERPTMAVYRPPVARQDRGKGKDDQSSPDKGRIKSPTGTKSPDKKDRPSERGYNKDRPRSYQRDGDYDKERERNREKERRIREQERRDRERERERKKDKDRFKDVAAK